MPNNQNDDWQLIPSAPFDCELELAVIEDGEPVSLAFPCRRVAGGWVEAQSGKRVGVSPTHWRLWSA